LNVPPGAYVAVAAEFSVKVLGSGDTYLTYFPKKMMDLTRVTTASGGFEYAGHYLVNASPGLCSNESDEIQMRVAQRIAPGTVKCGLFAMLLQSVAANPGVMVNSHYVPLGSNTIHYRGALREARREAADKGDFLFQAQRDLGSAGWVIESR
jgi:hypothetical protein